MRTRAECDDYWLFVRRERTHPYESALSESSDCTVPHVPECKAAICGRVVRLMHHDYDTRPVPDTVKCPTAVTCYASSRICACEAWEGGRGRENCVMVLLDRHLVHTVALPLCMHGHHACSKMMLKTQMRTATVTPTWVGGFSGFPCSCSV